jgi:hypothetical protein
VFYPFKEKARDQKIATCLVCAEESGGGGGVTMKALGFGLESLDLGLRFVVDIAGLGVDPGQYALDEAGAVLVLIF